MTVLVFANGDLPEMAWVRPLLAQAEAVIAADGGLAHVLALGRWPDVVIGDMDSLPAGVGLAQIPAGTRLVTYPQAKDETDLELALLYAAEHYQGEILLLAALGGRLDQMLANVLLLAHPGLAARPVTLVTAFQRAWLVSKQTTIRGAAGDRVSLIPLGGGTPDGGAQIAATTGLRWPLVNDNLAFGPARGISNEMTADEATVRLRSGRVLCVHTSGGWDR